MAVEDFKVLDELYYTKDHLWVKVDGNDAVIGITDYGQHQLGDVVYVELPKKGDNIEAGEKVASVESVKAAVDMISPLTGEIIEVNEDLKDEPNLINIDPYGDGWMFKVRIEDPKELERLLKPEDYARRIKEREGI
jgi:glycine cleavage system H protein